MEEIKMGLIKEGQKFKIKIRFTADKYSDDENTGKRKSFSKVVNDWWRTDGMPALKGALDAEIEKEGGVNDNSYLKNFAFGEDHDDKEAYD